MDLQLVGRRALVTGSSSGLGAGIARRLAAEGCVVTVHGRNPERTAAVAQSIVVEGGQAHAAVGDLSTEAGADRVAEAVAQGMGEVDILVNNAGGFEAQTSGNKAWFETAPEDWLSSFEGNVGSTVRMVRRFAPAMRTAGWGRIIQIASAVGVDPQGQRPDYETAKAAVINLSTGLAKALRGSGVTVNTVTPGAMRTPAFDGFLRDLGGKMGWAGDARVLEGRLSEMVGGMAVAEPDDVAVVAAFLASPIAWFVNGANVRADGGPR